ncbi:MAG: polysaccharide biosynthesis protein [Flavobacteriales bacterium]|nr:polysaccharide biosynthesis protein [Flavobacteriales bacterium]
MGVVAKQSVFNTILLYAGVVIGYLNVTIFFPRVIGAEGYGLTRVIISIVFISQHFAMLGTPSMVMRYFPRFKDKGGGGLFTYGFLVLGLGFMIVLAGLLFLKEPIIELKRENSPLLESYYFLAIPMLLAMALYSYFTNICRVFLQTVLPIFTYEFMFKVATALLLGLSWYFGWTLHTFLLSWASLYALNFMTLAIYLLWKKKLRFEWDIRINKAFVKESMDFSLFSMMAGASNSIISNIDILMVGLLLVSDSLEMAGIYAIMVYLGNAALMPTRGLSTIASPLAADYAEQKDKEKTAKLYERTSRNQMIAVGFLSIGVFVNLPNLLDFMQIEYNLGMPVFVFIGLARLVQSSSGINGLIINYSEFYRYTTYFIAGLAVVSIALNFLLIPIYALTGAALASFVSITGFELLKWIFVWRKLDLQPFHRKHIVVLALGIVLLAIGYFLPRLDNIWLDLLYRSSIVSLIGAVFILNFDISSDFRVLLIRGLRILRIRR